MTRQRARSAGHKPAGHRPAGQRPLRVAEELRHALVRIIGRGDLRDPDLADVSVTVTDVRMSADLRHAHCLVLPLGGGDSDRLVEALSRAAPYLRGQLGREIQLRYLPELVFAADRSFDRADEVERVLHRPEVARDLAPPGPDDSAEHEPDVESGPDEGGGSVEGGGGA